METRHEFAVALSTYLSARDFFELSKTSTVVRGTLLRARELRIAIGRDSIDPFHLHDVIQSARSLASSLKSISWDCSYGTESLCAILRQVSGIDTVELHCYITMAAKCVTSIANNARAIRSILLLVMFDSQNRDHENSDSFGNAIILSLGRLADIENICVRSRALRPPRHDAPGILPGLFVCNNTLHLFSQLISPSLEELDLSCFIFSQPGAG